MTEYVCIAELADRWGVSVATARNTTRTAGFPLPLQLGPRSLRFLQSAVLEWETRARRSSRRIHAGVWPQHRRQDLPARQVRTIQRVVA